MSDKKNPFPTLEGIIHSKPVKKVIGKKGENKGKELEIPSIVLEFTYFGGQRSQLVAFQLARNISIDEFAVGDTVIITYATESIPWKDDYITKVRAIYMQHANVDYNDTKDLRPQIPKSEPKPADIFVGAGPNDEPEDDGLPF